MELTLAIDLQVDYELVNALSKLRDNLPFGEHEFDLWEKKEHFLSEELENGFYRNHVDEFKILQITSTCLKTLSDTGLLILCQRMDCMPPRVVVYDEFAFRSLTFAQRKDMLENISIEMTLPMLPYCLFTLLGGEVVYYPTSKWSIKINHMSQLLFYDRGGFYFKGSCHLSYKGVATKLFDCGLLPWQNVCHNCFKISLSTMIECKKFKENAYLCHDCQLNFLLLTFGNLS